MGKRKPIKGEYNDFVDSEKLRDNAGVRTTLQGPSTDLETLRKPISPPARQRSPQNAVTAQEQESQSSSGRSNRTEGAKAAGQEKGKNKGKSRGKNSKGGPKKPPLTHFLCLPLVNTESRPLLEVGLQKLGREVEKSGLVPCKAIRPVGTLHLTLGVMSLDDESLEAAGKYLQELDLKALLPETQSEDTETGIQQKLTRLHHWSTEMPKGTAPPDPIGDTKTEVKPYIEVDLKSLVPMQKPRQTSILYAQPVDNTSRLRTFAEALKKEFTEKGFMVNEDRALKLHATIINTIYAKPNGRGPKGANGKGEGKAPTKAEPQTAPPDPSTAETEVPPTITGSGTEGEGKGESKPPVLSEGHGPNAKSWMRFDASELIVQYKDFVWAEGVRVDKVQICKMGAKKILGEGGEVVDERYEVVWEKKI